MIETAARLLAATMLALVVAGASGQGVEVEGVRLDATTQVGSAALQLNGAGVRTRLFFKVYVAGLYVPQKSTSAATLLAQTGPRRVAITMLRDVDAETFAGALTDGLAANHSAAQLAGWKAQVDALKAAMQAAGEARKGDRIHFDFIPGSGTRVVVNGLPRGGAIPGDDFYTAVLRIWLGDEPADKELKAGMLGS